MEVFYHKGGLANVVERWPRWAAVPRIEKDRRVAGLTLGGFRHKAKESKEPFKRALSTIGSNKRQSARSGPSLLKLILAKVLQSKGKRSLEPFFSWWPQII
ncbi:hypothetical protein KP509_14G029100 [Ceratopteris richardii]|uniref:Uncharacterized protein n=1 Tax=Ceratopteris richardii TaxID=49495 RepID=A0A8T2T850_CERRI|nr:hypothetical protein KP509_14G029100 [Ceratopteris richardii]